MQQICDFVAILFMGGKCLLSFDEQRIKIQVNFSAALRRLRRLFMMDIDAFLRTFYETISFQCGEKFKSHAFRRLFLPNASLLEAHGSVFVQKDIADHIAEFEDAVEHFPQLFTKGFQEIELSHEAIKSGGVWLVSSVYRKTYGEVSETGVNSMIVAARGDALQIASLVC